MSLDPTQLSTLRLRSESPIQISTQETTTELSFYALSLVEKPDKSLCSPLVKTDM